VSLKQIVQIIAGRAGLDIRRINPGQRVYHDLERCLGRKPTTAFDVGANVGQTALELVKHFPACRIFSFEPDPDTFAKLKDATARFPNVVPINLGLSDKSSTSTLRRMKNSVGNTFLDVRDDLPSELQAVGATKFQDSIDVTVQSIDEFCASRTITEIDYLKIDTQGYELSVLMGADLMLRSQKVRFVLLEVEFIPIHKGQASFIDIYAHMTDLGYQMLSIYNRIHASDLRLMWADVGFIL